MQFRQLLKVLYALVSYQSKDQTTLKGLGDILKKCDNCCDRRNEVIHSLWYQDRDEGVVVRFEIRVSRGTQPYDESEEVVATKVKRVGRPNTYPDACHSAAGDPGAPIRVRSQSWDTHSRSTSSFSPFSATRQQFAIRLKAEGRPVFQRRLSLDWISPKRLASLLRSSSGSSR